MVPSCSLLIVAEKGSSEHISAEQVIAKSKVHKEVRFGEDVAVYEV